jgi:uncharacterized membrane protein YuzA (DUF378 family)
MKKIGLLGWICQLIVIVAAIDWGLIGAFKLDLLSKIPGATNVFNIIQIVVGVAGAYLLLDLIFAKRRA